MEKQKHGTNKGEGKNDTFAETRSKQVLCFTCKKIHRRSIYLHQEKPSTSFTKVCVKIQNFMLNCKKNHVENKDFEKKPKYV